MRRSTTSPFAFLLFILATLFPLVHVTRAATVTFDVNTTVDWTDAAPGNGVCETVAGNGQCSLRAAVQETNALVGAETIRVPAGTFTFAYSTGSDEDAYTGDLDIRGNVTITGAGAGATIIDGSGRSTLDRVFDVLASGNATISGLTITGGYEAYSDGGGGLRNAGTAHLADVIIRDNNSGSSGGPGGGLYSMVGSTLTLDRVVISNNTAGLGGGLANAGTAVLNGVSIFRNTARSAGGGVHNTRNITVTNTTISENAAQGQGGGIFNSRTLVISNSTISSNAVKAMPEMGAGPASGPGGALYNDYAQTSATSTLTNVTVDNNSTSTGTGGIHNSAGSIVRLTNTILSRSSGTNCNTALTSLGHNLETGNSCGFTAVGDLRNTDPQLQALADNGGPTQTHALGRRSPAIDGADPVACSSTDQRGQARPIDGNGYGGAICDIGAFEAPQGDKALVVYIPLISR